MKVLVIEDEESIADLIKIGLEEEDYAVTTADNGRKGLELLEGDTYDIIILDVVLPDIDGLTLCSILREKNVHTPLIMLTGRSTVEDKVLGLDSGADDYLTKPFSLDELLARLRSLMRRRPPITERITYREMALDPVLHRVYVNGQEIALRPKEFSILLYLLRNRGVILTRNQILENVWSYQFNPNTNVVDVHIKYLRDKLSKYMSVSFLRTIKGVGYIIE